MLKQKYLYGFEDVTLPPSYISNIDSRSEINDINSLLYTAPMDTVVGDMTSLNVFSSIDINTVTVRGFWKDNSVGDFIYPHRVSLTLQEFKEFLLGSGKITKFLNSYKDKFGKYIILVDLANGHMKSLYDLSKEAKERWGHQIDLMIGNIAHPYTYKMYGSIGVDSVRVSIGTGAACLTSAKTAIHYPAISLLDSCASIKRNEGYKTKIVMDGGLKDSSYIIKALAAGADAVMLGSMFNKCLESSGEKRLFVGAKSEVGVRPLTAQEASHAYENGVGLYVKYRGMSTNEVQYKEKGSHRNYEEGLSKFQEVEYTVEKLLHELNYSIKSAFSYCDAKKLEDFYYHAELHLTPNSRKHNII